MQPFPTVKQIQQTLPFSPVFQNETTDADGEAYGLPVIMGGELAPVMRTLVLYDENMRYYVCAVLKAHSWEPKYNSAGCKAQTIAGWDVTLARQSSKLGQTLLQVEFGQNVTLFGLNMLVVNVGGGPVPYCKDFADLQRFVQYQREAPTRDEHKKLFMQRLTKRGHRLRCDACSLKEFTQLSEYEEVLNQETKAQQYFEAVQLSSIRHLKDILCLEQELLVATEREILRLQNFRDKANRLEDEANQRRAELWRQEKQQREDEKQRQFELEQAERKLHQEYLEEQEHQNQLRLLQELEQGQRLEQEQIAKQKAEARQRQQAIERQQAIDKQAANWDNSSLIIAYPSAALELSALQNHKDAGASIKIIRDRAEHLRKRSISSLASVQSNKPSNDDSVLKGGAILGGILGLLGGPAGLILGAVVGGAIGSMSDHPESQEQIAEKAKWRLFISEIDNFINNC